jgi:hypothetical protein
MTDQYRQFVEQVARLRISSEVGCPECGGPLDEEQEGHRGCLNCGETWPLNELDNLHGFRQANEAFDWTEALNRLIEDARAILDKTTQKLDESKTIPTVVVFIHDGLIDQVVADRPCRILILENDKYLNRRDYDGDAFVLWGDRPALLREWEVSKAEAEPGLPAKIQQANDCPRCENCGYPVPGGDYCYKGNSFAKLCEECAGDDNMLVND